MKRALFFLILIFTINLVGLYYRWYLTYSWFDQIEHLSGGFFVAMLFSVYLKNHLLDNSKLKNALIILSVVSFIGISWEFAEYIANVVLSPIIYRVFAVKTYFMGDLDDTVNDLLMGIIGAGVFALHFLRSRKTHKTQTNL